MRAIFIRHGEAESNLNLPSRLVDQHADLTPTGIEQIEATAKFLGNFVVSKSIYSSPYPRALQSAEIIARYLDLQVATEARLKEIDKGMWKGLPVREVIQKEAEIDIDERHLYRAPGGENWLDVGSRVASFIEDLHRGGLEEVLLLSHDHPIRMGIGALLKRPVVTWEDIPIGHASVTSLLYKNDEWRLDESMFNVRPY